MNPLLIIGVIVGVSIFVIIARLVMGRGKRLSTSAQTRILAQWKTAAAQPDTYRRIMEGDKVLDQLLKELGYQGSLGDKLKKADKIIPDIQAVWAAHKLRNQLAHEPGVNVSDHDAKKAMYAFEKGIRKFVALS